MKEREVTKEEIQLIKLLKAKSHTKSDEDLIFAIIFTAGQMTPTASMKP